MRRLTIRQVHDGILALASSEEREQLRNRRPVCYVIERWAVHRLGSSASSEELQKAVRENDWSTDIPTMDPLTILTLALLIAKLVWLLWEHYHRDFDCQE